MSDWVHIEVDEILKETDAAFRVRLEDGTEHGPTEFHDIPGGKP